MHWCRASCIHECLRPMPQACLSCHPPSQRLNPHTQGQTGSGAGQNNHKSAITLLRLGEERRRRGGKTEARPIKEQNSLITDSAEALAIRLSRGSNSCL